VPGGKNNVQRRLAALLVLALLLALASPAPAQQLQVTLVTVSSPVRPGDDATITIQTDPKASCMITVRYKSGPSRARGLSPQNADIQRSAAWTWQVRRGRHPGRELL
jgi:micrococcal nuclease